MIKSRVLALLYGGTTTVEDFHFDQLVAPPMLSFLTPTDVGDLHEIATSIRLSGDINKKYDYINTIMKRRNFARLAGGTNRIAYRQLDYSPIVVKVAIDREGVKNNPDEFRTQNYIKPFCTKVFETSPCGTVGMFERVERITSRLEFASIAEDVFNMISTVLVGKYVLEDIGTQFMYNWGIRRGFGPVLLDFPYIYELDGSKITCFAKLDNGEICGGEIDYDAGFNFLTCTKCGTQYRARELAREMKRPYAGGFVNAGTKGELKMKVAAMYGDTVVSEVDYKDVTQVVRKPKVIKYQRKKVTGDNISYAPKAVGTSGNESKSDMRKRYAVMAAEEEKSRQEALARSNKQRELKSVGTYVTTSTIYTPNGEVEVFTNGVVDPMNVGFVSADTTEEDLKKVNIQPEKKEEKPVVVEDTNNENTAAEGEAEQETTKTLNLNDTVNQRDAAKVSSVIDAFAEGVKDPAHLQDYHGVESDENISTQQEEEVDPTEGDSVYTAESQPPTKPETKSVEVITPTSTEHKVKPRLNKSKLTLEPSRRMARFDVDFK